MRNLLFNQLLLPVVFDGSKTITRRMIKPQKKITGEKIGRSSITPEGSVEIRGYHENGHYGSSFFKPRYKIGEIVYIPEPYQIVPPRFIAYKFDKTNKAENGWQNMMFMPEEYARNFAKITAVKAERLQEISNEDCLKEGIYELKESREHWGIPMYLNGITKRNIAEMFKTPQEAFAALINKINGKGTWGRNDFVWVYEFALCDKEGNIIETNNLKA